MGGDLLEQYENKRSFFYLFLFLIWSLFCTATR